MALCVVSRTVGDELALVVDDRLRGWALAYFEPGRVAALPP